MTTKYERRRPRSFRAVPDEAAHLHSSHSVTSDPDFTSPSQALEDALDLATELGTSDELCIDAFSLPFRHTSSSNSVRFCDEVQFLSKPGDGHGPHSQVLLHEELKHWADKPWGLNSSSSSITKARVCSAASSGQLPVGSTGEEAHPSGHERAHQPFPQVPPIWHNDLFTLLDEEGVVEEGEDDLVVYVVLLCQPSAAPFP